MNYLFLFMIMLAAGTLRAETMLYNGDFSRPIDFNVLAADNWQKYQWKPQAQQVQWLWQAGTVTVKASKMDEGAAGIRQWLPDGLRRGKNYRLSFELQGEGSPIAVNIIAIAAKETRQKDFTLVKKYFSPQPVSKKITVSFTCPLDIPWRSALLQFQLYGKGSFSLRNLQLSAGNIRSGLSQEESKVPRSCPAAPDADERGHHNLALHAPVSCSSELYEFGYPASGVTDGQIGNWGRNGGWNDATRQDYPDWVEIRFPYEKAVNLDRVVIHTLPGKFEAIRNFTVQVPTEKGWRDIAVVTGNEADKVICSFAPVKTEKIRINITVAPEYSRILEVEAYGDNHDQKPFACPVRLLEVKPSTADSVFPLGQSANFAVKLKNYGTVPTVVTLSWEAKKMDLTTVNRKTVDVALKPDVEIVQSIELPLPQAGPFYLYTSLEQNGMVFQYHRQQFGIRGSIVQAITERPVIPKTQLDPEIAHNIFYGINLGNDGIPISPKKVRYARDKGANMVLILCNWGYLEPFEGVYNFDYIDKSLQIAAENHMAAEIWLTSAGRYGPPWLLDLMEDSFGRVVSTRTYTRSFFSQRVKEKLALISRLLVERYKDVPNLKTLEITIGRDEAFYPDDATAFSIFDYSVFAQQAFRQYLQSRYTLAEINRWHGTAYSEWQQVKCPEPKWGKIDLRRIWLEFLCFKIGSGKKMIGELFPPLQQKAPQLKFSTASEGLGPLEEVFSCAKPLQLVCTCLNWEATVNDLYGCTAQRAGADIRVEGGVLPPREWNLGGLMFNNLQYQVKRYSWVGPMEDDNPAVSDYCRYKNAYVEVVKSSSRRPASVGILFSYDTIMSSNFSLLWGSWIWPYENLFKSAAFNHVPTEWLSDYEPSLPALLTSFKAVIDADSTILKISLVRHLATYVRNGGYLVLGFESGRWEYETGKPTFPLHRLLGLTLSSATDSASDLPGKIFSCGKGKVLLLKGEAKALTVKQLESISRWAGAAREIEISEKCRAILLNGPGQTWYVPVFHDDRYAKTKKLLRTSLRLLPLPDGVYRYEDLVDGGACRSGTISASSLRQDGVALELPSNRLAVIKLTRTTP